MSASKEALTSVYIVVSAARPKLVSKPTVTTITCEWCGQTIEPLGYLAGVTAEGSDWIDKPHYICRRCMITAHQVLAMGKQIIEITKKGGRQLYIAVEKTGQETVLLNVKRWSPLESLENADCVDAPLPTFQSRQE